MLVHYERLTATDSTFLRIETAHEPQHVGSLSVLEGAPLRDDAGRVRIEELRDHNPDDTIGAFARTVRAVPTQSSLDAAVRKERCR